jgi:trimethylamine--corrinoid protein Co-methyltransferase
MVITAWDEQGLADIIEMAELIAGGPAELALKPFIFAYLEPTSPLQHSEEALRKVLMMADKGLPFVYAPGPIDGASAPMTQAGALAMAAAEVLSGLVIAQNRRKGTPFVFGSGSGPLDMRTMTGTYAAPEFMLHCMGMAELAHYYYGLPCWGFAGCSDSKLPDIQAGIESALWILWMAIAGSNLVHDVGYVESGLTCSYQMIVTGDEVIGFVRRLMRGVDVTAETLALDVVDAVGPGGDFLGTDHTYDHFRGIWSPRVFDRRTYSDWVDAGRPDAAGNAKETARRLIAEHRPEPIPDDMLGALREMLDAIDARAGLT